MGLAMGLQSLSYPEARGEPQIRWQRPEDSARTSHTALQVAHRKVSPVQLLACMNTWDRSSVRDCYSLTRKNVCLVRVHGLMTANYGGQNLGSV